MPFRRAQSAGRSAAPAPRSDDRAAGRPGRGATRAGRRGYAAAAAAAAVAALVSGCSVEHHAADGVVLASSTDVTTVTCKNGPADASRVQQAIDSSRPGALVQIGGTCLLDHGLRLLPGRTYSGDSRTGTVLRQHASMPYVLASASYTGNSAATGAPLSIRQLTVACSGRGRTNGIVILNWQADVTNVDVSNCGGSGIVDTGRTASGRQISNTSVNSRFENNFITGSGDHGFAVIDGDNSVTDGYFVDNQVAQTGGSAISLQNSAGWTITGNHLYGDNGDGIVAERLYGSTISNNYIEDFAGRRQSGTWYGILGSAQGGSGSTIDSNKVFNDAGERSGAAYVYIAVTRTNYGTGHLAVTGNVIGGVRHSDIGLQFSGGTQRLTVAVYGNDVSGVGTVLQHAPSAKVSRGV